MIKMADSDDANDLHSGDTLPEFSELLSVLPGVDGACVYSQQTRGVLCVCITRQKIISLELYLKAKDGDISFVSLLTASERALVGVKDPVCLRKELFVDGKKEQEPRVIVSILLPVGMPGSVPPFHQKMVVGTISVQFCQLAMYCLYPTWEVDYMCYKQ